MSAAANMLRITDENHAKRLGEVHMRFALWAAALRRLPHWYEVADHFGVARSTAFRWLEMYRDASGIASKRDAAANLDPVAVEARAAA